MWRIDNSPIPQMRLGALVQSVLQVRLPDLQLARLLNGVPQGS